jgi:hypothetical protein
MFSKNYNLLYFFNNPFFRTNIINHINDNINILHNFPIFNPELTRIGFMWHNDLSYIPFEDKHFDNEIISNYQWFKPSFYNYIKYLSEKSQKSIIIDLITCELNSNTFIKEINELKILFPNIIINYSTKKIGNIYNATFLLENNTSIKNIYFKNSIDNFKFILGDNSLDFFINQQILLNQATSLRAQNTETSSLSSFDYIINFDIGNDSNLLFKNRSYQKKLDGVDIDLQFNHNFINNIIASKTSILSIGNPTCKSTGISNDKELFGLRLLEIIAIKIFGHAKARSAIGNDSEFYNLTSGMNQLIGGMQQGINVKALNIFDSYVQDDRIQKEANGVNSYDDVGKPGYFNFQNTNWLFPVYFSGQLQGGNLSLLNNGPNVGGTQLINGVYNIPLLFVLQQS